jgi:oligosaccharide 4-alpha-D-glucosyltransferase
MGINKWAWCLLLLFNCGSLLAQGDQYFPLESRSAQGSWKMEQFPSGILKVVFEPLNYTTNEQVSNAVLLKPVRGQALDTKPIMNGGNKGFTVVNARRNIEMLGYFDSASYKGFRFKLFPGEKIMGTGERSVPLNRRGYKLQLYNNPAYGYSTNAENLNYSVPFIISSAGYAIFFDNPSRGYLDIGKNNPDILEYGASSGQLAFYIITGRNTDELLRKYHELTGPQPLPARWVFGNLMSRFGYRSQEQVASTVRSMQEQHFPVDAVILDLFWFGDSIKGTLGNLDWVNKTAWPAPSKMISDLGKQGIKTILITEPFVLQTTPNYEPSKKLHATDSAGNPFVLTDFYFGNGGLLDIFKKETQDWFWSKYKKQINIGVAGWWGDLGEPETHPENVYHNLQDLGFKRTFRAHEVHNIYGHYWDKMLYDRYAKEYPATRLFNLNRSGYAGSPRYGVFPWSGDVSRSWEGLQAQLPLMIGMSMSGVPYIHADAGGFAGGEGDKELYTRWLQFATFTPVFRPHGTAFGDLDPGVKDIPSEAAFYDEPYKSIVRNTIQLRYRLLPYNYTLGYEQAKYGKPLVRPLFYYSDTDSNLYKTDNQYMWGDVFLIAPVLKKDAGSMAVYLPEGKWYQYHRDEQLEGGRWINEKLALDDIPVFIKAGSFVPMFKPASPVKNTGQYTGRKIFIKYYPSQLSSQYILYDDDGHTKNSIEKGNYELIRFAGIQKNKMLFINIRTGGKKILQSRELTMELPAGFNIKNAKLNKHPVKVTGNKIILAYSGKQLELEISLK